MKTRTLSLSLASVLTASLLAASPAWAWKTVFDPSNYTQNTLTAVRTLQQINNQINQLQNEAQMLMNQARNLTSLDFNVVNRLRTTLATSERLIGQAQGLTFDVAHMDQAFARLYPDQYAATVSGDQMAQDARARWQNTLDGLHTAMRMQAQASQNLRDDESALADLVGQSQSATGALQAAQATNQLLALQAKQAIQAQQLQITQDRAAALELARQAASTERAREVRRRFRGDGTPYTPHAVQFYGH
ncbi:P-type conjugative transfer protein TrbJ [Pollutimonas subterranea]|uniref:P-type conjugative transfer protein TrbJ n=1 Tax=Pollutimonas subterranea TaxID=2045210 RepID=A0A2N4U795_9BURK|nr:P-type conjugative transfer protein TrbJ [Pollutimonas subterranea]PLC50892.1 P-type conjugative transfer protein TrbJ [Pollutimonas subterranea]